MLKKERNVQSTGQSHATMRKLRGDAGAGSQEWPDAVGVEQDPVVVVPEENPLDDGIIVDNGTFAVKQEDVEEYQNIGNQPGPAPRSTSPNSTELTAGQIHPPKKSGKKQDLTEEAKAKKEAKAKAIEDAKAAKEAKAAAREEAKTEKQAQAKVKAEAREKAKAEAKAMKEAKEKAKEEVRAKAKEEAKAKQEAKAKAREDAKAKKETKSSAAQRTKPNADKSEVTNVAGSNTRTQAEPTATSSTTTPPDDLTTANAEEETIKQLGLASLQPTITEESNASGVATKEIMDVHVEAADGVEIPGSRLLSTPSKMTDAEFKETGGIADSVMNNLTSEGARLPGSGSLPVASQIVTMVDVSSSKVSSGCVMIGGTSTGTETLDSKAILLEDGSRESAPTSVVMTRINMSETRLESSDATGLDQERKRKTGEGSQESSKRHCPNPEDVDVGSFTVFVINSQRQASPEILKTFLELGLVETVQSGEVKQTRCVSHLQEQIKADIWCVEVTTTGKLTHKLNDLLNQSNRSEAMDTLNTTAYGNKSPKRVFLAKEMTQSAMARTTFLLILQRTLGTLYKVYSQTLVAHFGRRITISECFREFPEPAVKAYQFLNRYAKEQVGVVIKTETKERLNDTVGADTLNKLRGAIRMLNGPKGTGCTSLLKRHLTAEVCEILANRKTECGRTLFDCITVGIKNLNLPIGIFAAAPDAYSTFDTLFDKVIYDLHGFGGAETHPPTDLGDGDDFPPLDIGGNYIISTRIKCARTVEGWSFLPSLSKYQLHSMEDKFKKAFKAHFRNDMAGTYFRMTPNARSFAKMAFNEHLLHNDKNQRLENAGAKCHWPIGRGLFINTQQTFFAYANVEEHVELVATENGSNVGSAWKLIKEGLRALGKEVRFLWDERLGWINSNPSNLGSAVRASVRIRLPRLSARNNFLNICSSLNLRARKDETTENTYFLSNKSCLGITERESVNEMYAGVRKLIQMEETSD